MFNELCGHISMYAFLLFQVSESLKWGNIGMNMGVMLVSQNNARAKAKSVWVATTSGDTSAGTYSCYACFLAPKLSNIDHVWRQTSLISINFKILANNTIFNDAVTLSNETIAMARSNYTFRTRGSSLKFLFLFLFRFCHFVQNYQIFCSTVSYLFI